MKIKPIQIGNTSVNEITITPVVIDLEKQIAQWTSITSGEKISYSQNFLVEKLEFTNLLKDLTLDHVLDLSINGLGFEKELIP
jgi:hypothetical protein